MPYLLFDENGTLNYIRLTRGFLLTLGCTPDCNIVLPPGNCPHFRIADSDGVADFIEFEGDENLRDGAVEPLRYLRRSLLLFAESFQ